MGRSSGRTDPTKGVLPRKDAPSTRKAITKTGPKEPGKRTPKAANVIDLNAARGSRTPKGRKDRDLQERMEELRRGHLSGKLPFEVPSIDAIERQFGQPTKLTDATMRRVVELVAAGNYPEVAAQASGVGRTTYYRWMQESRMTDADAEQEGISPERLRACRDFRDAIVMAESYAEVWYLDVVRRGVQDDPRLAMVFLERRAPARFGRINRVQADITSRTAGEGEGVEREIPVETASSMLEVLRDIGAVPLLMQQAGELPSGDVVDGELVEEEGT